MADYYPLVDKAVAALADTASESRHALYDRMRAALLGALRTTEPRFTHSEITREQMALEDAVRRVEQELAESTADANVPLMIVTGSASGRFNSVWRCTWR
jgi:hypothetical protein